MNRSLFLLPAVLACLAAAPAGDMAAAERCAGLTAALVEVTPSADPAERRAYAVWTSHFSALAAKAGVTPTEVSRRLEAGRLAAQAQFSNEADVALARRCVLDAEKVDPFAVKPLPPAAG
jgi:hypothetical protein